MKRVILILNLCVCGLVNGQNGLLDGTGYAPNFTVIIEASWSQENTANIIPNPEIKSHISFLIFFFISLLYLNKNSPTNVGLFS